MDYIHSELYCVLASIISIFFPSLDESLEIIMKCNFVLDNFYKSCVAKMRHCNTKRSIGVWVHR